MGSVVVVEVLEAVDEQIVRNANQDAWSLILNEVAQPWKRLRRDSIQSHCPTCGGNDGATLSIVSTGVNCPTSAPVRLN